MSTDLNNIIGMVGGGLGSAFWTTLFSIIGIISGVILLGIVFYIRRKKKKWNINAEIKLIRSGGKISGAEWGKASFNADDGVCYVKRPGKGMKAVAVRVFDIRLYVQGENTVTFLQLAPNKLVPVFAKSYEEYVNNKPLKNKNGEIVYENGEIVYEKASVLDIEVDAGEDRAWQASWEQTSSAFTLKSLLQQYQTPIAIGIVLVACFVGFSILWARLGSVCG